MDGDEQVLPGLSGLVRSVRSPEFDGVTFHEIRARSVLNRVPGGSLPFGWTVNPYRGCSHACTYCLAGDTEILMADGRTRQLADLTVGAEIYGTESLGRRRRYVRTRVLAHWSTVKHAYRITLADGTELVASGDHRFLTDRGWKHVTAGLIGTSPRPWLRPGSKLVGTGAPVPGPADTIGYRAGYLCGTIRGDGSAETEASDRAREFLSGFESMTELAEVPTRPVPAWQKGFLAGIFDTEGSGAATVLRIADPDELTVDTIRLALARFGFRYTVDGPGDDGMRTVRLLGGTAEHLRFFQLVDPAISRKRRIDGVAIKSTARIGVVSVEPLGLELPLFDITTGTGDFIANGMVSHNCFARNTHTYLDFDAGRDFDTQVVVKLNAPEVLAAQLRRPGWRREHVAMGTNTDPYQRAEGRYRLMPGIIRALAGSGTPFSILTKGTMLTRDLPLLTEVAKDVSVGLNVSIALLDRDLQRRLEPGTPSPQARLELVRRARAAGLPCGVLVAPVLPGLTDSAEQLDRLFAAIADAGATGATVIPLHLRPGAREWFASWLGAEHPELVPRYRELYGGGSYAGRAYRRLLSARVAPLLRRHGLAPDPGEGSDWPSGSVPGQRAQEEGAGPAAGEQMRLL